MKARCVDNFAWESIFTVGKVYAVDNTSRTNTAEYYGIRGDDGERYAMRAERFVPVVDVTTEPDVPRTTALLPTDRAARKATPVATGVLRYFPRALAYVARVSHVGNEQHNPGQPLHWDRTKSGDHDDCMLRHYLDEAENEYDTDQLLHAGKVAWRALARLELILERKA